MCGITCAESGKVQEVYKLLLPLKSWLTEQEEKMNSMRPAAVLSAPLSDQINENEVRTLYIATTVCVCNDACTHTHPRTRTRTH